MRRSGWQGFWEGDGYKAASQVFLNLLCAVGECQFSEIEEALFEKRWWYLVFEAHKIVEAYWPAIADVAEVLIDDGEIAGALLEKRFQAMGNQGWEIDLEWFNKNVHVDDGMHRYFTPPHDLKAPVYLQTVAPRS